MVMYQIQLKVLAVRRLPQTFFDQERRRAALAGAGGDAPPTSRRGFRAQAKLGGEGRETGISVWGRGAGVKDARWLPGGDSMVWKVSESTWKHVRAHSPKVKVHLYASDADTPRMETSEAVGWFTIDLRELASGSMDARALKLQGCSPAEVTVEGSLAVVRGDKGKGREARAQAAAELVAEESAKSLQAMPLPAAEALADLDALPIGESATSSDARVFQLCVELKSASGLASLAPHLDGVGVPFWFSYSLFDVVIQTEKFPRLSPEPKSDSLFEPIRDTFRLLATPGDLRRFLADSAPLQIYLCSEGRVIAHSSVELKLVLQGADADLTFAMSEGEYPLVRYDGSHSSSVEASIKCLVSVTHDEEVPIQPQEGSAVAPVAPSFAAEVSDVAKGTSSDVVVASPSSPGEPAGTAAAEGDGQGVAGVAGKPLDNRPHRWRLTVNLVSVKDLDSAAYVLAAYQYPHLGTCAPVRTAVSWAPPRGETPLANSVCTFEFGMSPERLANCAADHPFIVVLRSKERHGERDIGLVRLPLEDLALSTPRCYRCSSTGKNFANAPAYRSYRATRPDRPEPVVVRAVDSYLTVTSADSAALADGAHQPAKRHLPERVCSLRCSMMLEDFGPTKGKDSSAIPTSVPTSGVAVSSPSVGVEHLHAADPESGGGRPEVSEPRSPRQPVSAGNEPPAAGSPDTQDHFTYRVSADAATPSAPQDLQQLCDRELQLLQHEWDTWRTKEEMTWARRLAEKDAALEARWREQDAQRILAVSAAAADYAKLEGKLRKSLGEVEARERALKAKTESFQMEHARKLDELQLLQRRLRDETRHQVDVERMKVTEVERRLSVSQKALKTVEAQVKATEEEFDRYRQAQRRTQEGGLKAEVARLQAAKAELEAAVERERSEKHKAMLQREEFRAHIHKLGRALRKHQEKDAAAARRELEQLRLEYLAREERYMLDGDRDELRSIRNELEELRMTSHIKEACSDARASQSAPAFGQGAQSEVDRLRKWRAELLNSGAYSRDHQIIKELDRQLGLAIAAQE